MKKSILGDDPHPGVKAQPVQRRNPTTLELIMVILAICIGVVLMAAHLAKDENRTENGQTPLHKMYAELARQPKIKNVPAETLKKIKLMENECMDRGIQKFLFINDSGVPMRNSNLRAITKQCLTQQANKDAKDKALSSLDDQRKVYQ